MLLRHCLHLFVGTAHRLGEFLAYTRELPAIALDILRPLEITDGHAASIGEDIRNNLYATFYEDLVRKRNPNRKRGRRIVAADVSRVRA